MIASSRLDAAEPGLGLARRDVVLVTLAALLAGGLALAWAMQANLVLAYSDSLLHLNVARRVLDSKTPGVAQLGTVWLPVPHILMLPFIWIDPLWRSGLAGSLVGLGCLAITAVAVFGSVRLIARRATAAWVSVAILLTNPNVLYVHTTALTEPVLLMAMTASSYFLLRWTRTMQAPSLIAAGALAMLAIGSRYDGWFFAVACGGIVLLVSLLRSRNRGVAEGLTIAYVVLPAFAMFLWVYYNWLIWGDPLEFQRGQFSAQFQQTQIAAAVGLKTKGDLLLSAITYSLDVVHTTGLLVVGVALVGLLIYTFRQRRDGPSIAPYALLASYPFNILSLFAAQTIITLPESDPPGYFNVRYGLMLVPGLALFAGYAFDQLGRVLPRGVWATGAAAILGLQVALYVPGWPLSVITVADGLVGTSARPPHSDAAAYLGQHYQGGSILVDDTQAAVFFDSALPMRDYVATYSGPLWRQALTDPGGEVEWIVMHTRSRTDLVSEALLGNPVLQREFTLEFEDPRGGLGVYHRRDASASPATPAG